MAKTVNEVINYFNKLYDNKAIYLWGANSETITKTLVDRLYNTYGNEKSTYNRAYYDNKLKEGAGKIGADCSGAMYPMSGFDTTAQNYYNKCDEKGVITNIDTNKVCLVFKGKSTTSINHIGMYLGNGYVVEMKSSKANCTKTKLSTGNWKWYGVPNWINYTSTNSVVNSIMRDTRKCIDVSSYQGNINWKQVKTVTNKVILKVIRKDLSPDKKFEEYWTGCENASVNVIGVYNYSYATTVEKAKSDAKRVLEILNGRKVRVWLDVEDKCQQGLGVLLKDIINAYQYVIESAGYEFGVYTGMSFYQSFLKPYESQIKCKTYWLARYYNSYNKMNISVDPNEQYNPKTKLGLSSIYAWQYTSSGQVPGITGNVDINMLYSDDKTLNKPSVLPTKETSVEMLGKVNTSSGNLNIRLCANSYSNIVGKYEKGAIIEILAKNNNGWYRTNKGYVSDSYVKQAVGKVCNCFKLNMRSSAEVRTDNKITVLSAGDNVYLLKRSGEWLKVKTSKNVVGYVSSKYIQIM